MGKNNLQKLTPTELVALATQMHGPLSAQGNDYDVPTAYVSALAGAGSRLAASNADVDAKKAAYHASVQARSADANGLSATIATVARMVYGNGQCSPSMIAALGLSPRSEFRTKVVPQTPTDVVASALPDKRILVRFEANNPYGVTYQIEAQTGSGWETVAITTTQKAEIAGFAPGTMVAFRVIAVKNGQSSPPSDMATPYGVSIAPALRLAA